MLCSAFVVGGRASQSSLLVLVPKDLVNKRQNVGSTWESSNRKNSDNDTYRVSIRVSSVANSSLHPWSPACLGAAISLFVRIITLIIESL